MFQGGTLIFYTQKIYTNAERPERKKTWVNNRPSKNGYINFYGCMTKRIELFSVHRRYIGISNMHVIKIYIFI